MIDKSDFDVLDLRYKRIEDCNREMDEVSKKLANDATQLAVINTKLSLVLWLLGAIGVAMITVLVKYVFAF